MDESGIFITGNTVIDALKTTVRKDYEFFTPELKDVDFNNRKIITMTAHRRENLGKPLEQICNAVYKHGGFSASCPGQHKKRTFGGKNGFFLFVIESV